MEGNVLGDKRNAATIDVTACAIVGKEGGGRLLVSVIRTLRYP